MVTMITRATVQKLEDELTLSEKIDGIFVPTSAWRLEYLRGKFTDSRPDKEKIDTFIGTTLFELARVYTYYFIIFDPFQNY